MLGIDIASYQSRLNLSTAKNSGIETVIIKATEGVSYKNPCMQTHVEQAKANGLNFGLYHYYSPSNGAEEQAKFFCDTIRGLGYNVIPVLDFEDKNISDKSNNINKFMNYCTKALGVTPVLYTYASFLNYLDSSTYQYKLWVAFYMSMSSTIENLDRCKQLYPIVNNYTLCGYQFASCYRINGYNGNLDVDRFYDNILLGSAVTSTPVQATSQPIQDTPENPRWRNVYDPQIAELQRILNAKGHNLKVDGYIGPKTYGAVKGYTINLGDRGPLTKWVQDRLNTMQYNAGYADGYAEQPTMDGIARFQRSYGLGVGYLGGTDWYYLTNR